MSDKFIMNRLANVGNRFQGSSKRVLCVCSAGLLRSPTAAVVLSQKPFSFNTRAAGLYEEFALVPVDEVLIEWADEIVCMETDHEKILQKMTDKPIRCLKIPDRFFYMDEELVEMIKQRYSDVAQEVEATPS